MSKPFRGVVNLDIRDSVPDWEPYEQPKAPDGAPNVLFVGLGRHGLGGAVALWRPDRDADVGTAR
jgi:arylsulfatase